MGNTQYEFTADWFSHNAAVWKQLIESFGPSKILEVGSYEGRSTCFLIETIGARKSYDIYCVDPWRKNESHAVDMDLVEKRFDANIALAAKSVPHQGSVSKFKGSSLDILPGMLASGHRESFDLIYVDGSHEAPDVLFDAVLSFQLCRAGGLLIFDDYLWSPGPEGGKDVLKTPKPAIDAFVNIFMRNLRVMEKAPLYQLYLQKVSA